MEYPAGQELVRAIEDAISSVMAPLPAAAYTLRLAADEEIPERGFVVVVEPTNPRSATMRVHVADGDPNADIFLGADSRVELFARSRQRGLGASSLVEECALIAQAIVAGRVQETLLLQGDDILESRCVIETSGAAIKTARHTLGSKLSQRTRTETRLYEPYAEAVSRPDSAGHSG